MTANQVVAYNLRRAREERHWTQEVAARALEQYLGRLWSKASFSSAERSAEDGRVRVFDANELLAFSRVFNRPVGWFFTPPDGVDDVECGVENVQRVVRREELVASSLSHGLALHDHVERLRHIANELERADEAALRAQREEH